MKRKEIAELISTKYPCYAISTKKGECTQPYAVLKYENQVLSTSNNTCGWQYLNVFCYVPQTNILELDSMVSQVVTLLKDRLEFTGEITPEIFEEDKNAYSRKIRFRIPKEVM